MSLRTWPGSLHQTFRLLPPEEQSRNLRAFLSEDTSTVGEILARLPYDAARAQSGTGTPDAKRYRDGKQVYQTIGLVYEDTNKNVHTTRLGRAVYRWTNIISSKNYLIFARHAAYALAACQLRNPTGAGRRFDTDVEVFPFAFIWRAMLALDAKISSDELNRSLFRVTNEGELDRAIEDIRVVRKEGDITRLGPETVSGDKKNDRIIPWLSLASFGWLLFPDKRGSEDSRFYAIPEETRPIIEEAASIEHPHKTFSDVPSYVLRISAAASLPMDLR